MCSLGRWFIAGLGINKTISYRISVEFECGNSNNAMQIDAVRAIRLHEWSCLPFYHANGHRIQRD